MKTQYTIRPDDKIPARNAYSKDAEQERKIWLEKKMGIPLDAISNHSINPKKLRGVVENFVGAIQVPIGMAGPLLIHGDHASGLFYAPLATVEGVVAISTSRGASVINKSGGVRVKILDQQMSRCPVFQFATIDEVSRFSQWIRDNFDKIKEQCEKLSSHGKLLDIGHFPTGNSIHLRFSFFTGDAAGQNMTTIMTDGGCAFIQEHFQKECGIAIQFYMIEGNMAGDKKFNMINHSSARGIKVIAETFIEKDIFEKHLQCSVSKFATGVRHAVNGTILSGTPGGFSVNASNIIAAIYAATGNDLGCVVESSQVHIYCEARSRGLYWSIQLPNIVVGTVAGAHRLPTQKECLKILKCDQPGGALKLAEIIASFCLALDLSTSASIANDTFGKAHRIWGRES